MTINDQELNQAEIDLISGGVTEGPNGEGCTDPRPGPREPWQVQNVSLPEIMSGF